jgi:hypothetical protein
MNSSEHPRSTRAGRPSRRLSLLALAIALAGCAGGGDTDVGVLTGSPEVGVPASPVTSGAGAPGSGASGSGAAGSGATGSGATGSGGGSAVTEPSNPTASPTSPDDAPVDIEVGGPSLNVPGAPVPIPLQSFGEAAVGTESAPRRFRLRSRLGDAVDVLALRIDGDGSFPLTDDQCTGATLQPGASGGCAFTVVFRPRQQGAAAGEVLVRLTQRCDAGADPPCDAGAGAELAKGRAALVRERTVASLVGHATTAPPGR